MSLHSATLQRFHTRLRENWRPGLIGAGIAAGIGLLFLMSATLGGGLKNLSYDLPYLLRIPFHSVRPVTEVAIVYMDEPSHTALKQPWMQAWDRGVHAEMIETLHRAGAKAIVLDILFDTPATNDARLVEAARRSGRVAAGSIFVPQSYRGEIIGYKANPPIEPLRSVVKWGGVETAAADLAPRQHFRGDFKTPSLAWRVAEMTLPPPLPDPFGARWLNFYGPPGTIPFYSYVDVLSNNVPPATFSNKVVFIGAQYKVAFTGGKGTDDFRTPFTPWYATRAPGVEINATTYLNLVRGDWFTELSPLVEFILVLVSGAVLGFGLVCFRPSVSAALALVALAFVLAFTCLLGWRFQLWFPWMTIACLQVPVALGWAILASTSRLSREKQTLEKELAAEKNRIVLQRAQRASTPITHTTVAPPGSPLQMLGPDIPNHEMLRCIGRGAYGEVWLARDEIGTYHAVKLIHRNRFSDNGPYDREFRGIQRYTPISRSHRGLVHILHVGRNSQDGYFFYIMELGDCEVNGTKVIPETYMAKNLARQLDVSVLSVKDCLPLAIDLADALEFLHSQGLIHRDIKPSNVIFVNGAPKFADVGLVTTVAEKGGEVTYIGTEGFIAPEGPGTPVADVFSLGKVIYEAVMGRHASQFPELPTSLTSRDDLRVLMKLNEIINRACAPKPEHRYKSAAELKDDLARLQGELAAAQETSS